MKPNHYLRDMAGASILTIVQAGQVAIGAVHCLKLSGIAGGPTPLAGLRSAPPAGTPESGSPDTSDVLSEAAEWAKPEVQGQFR